jgi:hypothetical protein
VVRLDKNFHKYFHLPSLAFPGFPQKFTFQNCRGNSKKKIELLQLKFSQNESEVMKDRQKNGKLVFANFPAKKTSQKHFPFPFFF